MNTEMKTLGLLGGMSWESTTTYYQAINQGIREALGELHSAPILLYSFNFSEIETLQRQNRWDEAGEKLAQAAQTLEKGGADCLMLCTNTMHKVIASIEHAIQIPVLHIADATGQQLQADGVTCAGLLGTKFTMEEAFYKDRLTEKFAIDICVPHAEERDLVHQVIYRELCQGVISPRAKAHFLTIIKKLQSQGAQAIILGCTEIALLIQQEESDIPLYDTTQIHATQGAQFALGLTAMSNQTA